MSTIKTAPQTYYMIKAYQWLRDHGARPETDPTPLAEWAESHSYDYDEWRWALVAEDGKVVGEAYPSHHLDSTIYYITLATAQKYGLAEGTLKPTAGLALPVIEKQLGKRLLWAREAELSGHVWLHERTLYNEAKARYGF
ncbi:MAG: hypothetical protein [Caudoviricetes sp.]|nr:MAG: hypothetical protein [Caudoviricetes sp.]